MTLKQIKKEDYDFFDHIDRYIINGESIELTSHAVESSGDCTSFAIQWGIEFDNKEIAKNICNRLISIYKILSRGQANYNRDDNNYEKDFAFLNYWLNWKIHEGKFNQNTPVKNFIDIIESHKLMVENLDIDNPLIYDINKDDLYEMNILYRLYMNYKVLDTILENASNEVKVKSLSHSTACCKDYLEARYICDTSKNESNIPFCNKLKVFKTKYDELVQKVIKQGSEVSDYLIKLEECPNNKIITTAVTGSIIGLIPLFGVLYKFTPMGQMFRSKKGILNNYVSNNEEEMTNMPLMEQGNEPIRFQQGTYNIKYQSL